MSKQNYELVLIFTPATVQDGTLEQVISHYKNWLTTHGAEIIEEDLWGLRQLAYPIGKNTTGAYLILEFTIDPTQIRPMEVQFRRDERVMRFITVKLDKYGVEYNERRRAGLVGKNRRTSPIVSRAETVGKEPYVKPTKPALATTDSTDIVATVEDADLLTLPETLEDELPIADATSDLLFNPENEN